MKSLLLSLLSLSSLLLLFWPSSIGPVIQASVDNGCVPAPFGMVSWWPGDEDANDIADGNHGTLQNGATFAPGKVAQAFSFDGADDAVEIPNSPAITPPTELTIDAWVRWDRGSTTSPKPTNGIDDFDVIVAKFENLNNRGYGFAIDKRFGDKLVFSVSNNGTSVDEVESPSAFTPFVFQHVAAIFRPGSLELYINGVLVAQKATSFTNLYASTVPLTVGKQIGTLQPGQEGRYFKGLIDEVEIFNRALSAAEVLALYNAGSAGKCKDADGDGVNDAEDTCPTTPNPGQGDFDMDGVGDACDAQTGPPKFKDQCKNGGWMRFDFPGAFKNQGDCIQFVNTGK